MKQRLLDRLVCPQSGSELKLEVSKRDGDEIIEGALVSAEGKRHLIRNGIPRFVSSEEYTDTFGFQWNRHSRIYFDNKDQHRIYSTQDQLQRKLGLTQEKVKGKVVLDIGCGTGANGAALAEWGAQEVFCVDLSSAVDAANTNTKNLSNVHVIRADLFKLPSRFETFGIVILEAMAFEKPVIATTAGGIPEIIENGKSGILVPPDDPGALADAIIVVLRDRALRSKIARNGYIRVTERYGNENTGAKYEADFDALVHSPLLSAA